MPILIHRYVDGELDVASAVEVEQHLRDCSACVQACDSLQRLKTALRDRALYAHAPLSLQRSLEAALQPGHRERPVTSNPGTSQREPSPVQPPRSPAPPISSPATTRPVARLPRARVWFWGSVAVAMICLFIGSLSLRQRSTLDAAEERMAQEVVAGHVRSLLAHHLTDLTSADQHTTQTWFRGKLTFAVAVPKPSPAGSELMGGRLDYVDNKPVAALVYKQQQHIINVFICPALHDTSGAPSASGAAASTPATLTQRGYHICYIMLGDLTYWAVSDLDAADLAKFTTQVIPSVANHCA